MLSNDYKAHIRRNITLALPVMLSQLGHVSVGVADSIMVGRLGAVPLAAASLSNSIFYVLFMFGVGVSMAITPLIAAADGEHNVKKSAEVFKNGMLINLIVGGGLFLLITTASQALYYMNQPADVVKLALPYLSIISLSIIPFMFFQAYKQFAEGLSFTKQAMYITIGANVLNVGLNYILIYGKLGFEPMGLAGAGWATLISRIVMAAIIAHYIYTSRHFKLHFKGFRFSGFSRKISYSIVRIGFPTGLQYVFEVGAFSCAAIMVGWLGASSLAAHQIAINLASISYMMATGISAAATVRVGNQLGKRDIPTLRTAGFTSFLMGGAFMTVSAIIFIAGSHFLPALYIKEEDVIQMASTLLVIAAFFQISDGIQVVGLGALRGLSDVKMPTLITLVAYWVLGLPFGYFLSFQMEMGARGIWFGLLTGLTVAGILLFIRFNSLTRKLLPKRQETIVQI